MDFDYSPLVVVSALMMVVWAVGHVALGRKRFNYLWPALLAWAFGLLFLKPWQMGSWSDVPWLLTAWWLFATPPIVIGCLLGAIPTALILWLGSKLLRRAKE